MRSVRVRVWVRARARARARVRVRFRVRAGVRAGVRVGSGRALYSRLCLVPPQVGVPACLT